MMHFVHLHNHTMFAVIYVINRMKSMKEDKHLTSYIYDHNFVKQLPMEFVFIFSFFIYVQ